MRILRPLRIPFLLLAWLVVLFGLQRLLFFALNAGSFPHPPLSAFLGGIRFDLSAIAWLNAPWLFLLVLSPSGHSWLASLRKYVFLLTNSAGFFFNCVDLEYYKFTLKRSTADLFGIATGGSDLAHVMPVFLVDYWYVVLIFIASVAALAIGHRWITRSTPVLDKDRRWPVRLSWRAIMIASFLLLSRGGLQLIPLQPLDAATYASPAYIPLVLNSPFTIMTSIGKPVVEERNYMSQAEADRIWPVVHTYGDTAMVPSKPNVVVIILESFSAAYSDALTGRDLRCMPFLDSVMHHGLYFTNAYANGRRSIDGIPAVLAGMPKLMDEAFITSSYATTPFTSLASVLRSEGYNTSFFHGGHNGTMGFDAFCHSAGFQEYIGRDQYPDPADDDGVWGIRDRPFFQFFARSLNERKEPFLAGIFSLSSHHPYELPPADAERFKGGDHKIMATLRYSDDAVRQFFNTAKGMPWYKNTLFVITADHTADLDRDGQTSNRAADYWVPIVFYMPGHIAPQKREDVVQQIDIFPTVLDLMGCSRRFVSFGNSVFRQEHPHCAVVSNNNVYVAVGQRSMLQFNGEHPIGPVPEGPDLDTLTTELKAAIQQFNGRLLAKDLVIQP